MIGESILKVPNGKLIRVSVDFESSRILSANITGDFFIHPEETIESIEESLTGCETGDVEARITAASEGAKLYGANPHYMAQAVLDAMGVKG